MKAYGKVKTIAKRCDISERTVRTWLKAGLPYCKVRGTILIKFDQLDDFLGGFIVEDEQVDRIVTEVLNEY